MTWRELSPAQLYSLREPLIIDVRSPCEHEVELIPNSVNVPLLDNEQRTVVGTVYAQEGEMIARRLALKFISPNIPNIVDRILELRRPGQAVVVHCWRGGLRSETVASFLAVVGVDCWRLTGGYKGWRKMVLNEFASDDYPIETVVLHGQTGAGKTDILIELEALGAEIIDLEALANHRGSVFGGVGLGEQPSQKDFEAGLWMKLRAIVANSGDASGSVSLDAASNSIASPETLASSTFSVASARRKIVVFVEAEGRKIGKLALPDFLLRRMNSGKKVLVECSLEARVDRIFNEYSGKYGDSFEVLDQAFAQLGNLKERIGAKSVEELKRLVVLGEGKDAVRMLLLEYYDSLYDKQIKRFEPYQLTITTDDPKDAAQQILTWSHISDSAVGDAGQATTDVLVQS